MAVSAATVTSTSRTSSTLAASSASAASTERRTRPQRSISQAASKPNAYSPASSTKAPNCVFSLWPV
jgi:hypothetical protein